MHTPIYNFYFYLVIATCSNESYTIFFYWLDNNSKFDSESPKTITIGLPYPLDEWIDKIYVISLDNYKSIA